MARRRGLLGASSGEGLLANPLFHLGEWFLSTGLYLRTELGLALEDVCESKASMGCIVSLGDEGKERSSKSSWLITTGQQLLLTILLFPSACPEK